jgi:hypothetical protein
MLAVNGHRSLHFARVLDTYEEIEDGTSLDNRNYNREYWAKRSKPTLDTADTLVAVTHSIFGTSSLNYVKYYIAIAVSGNNYLWLHKRSMNKSLLGFRMIEALQDEIAGLLDAENIAYVRKPRKFLIIVDKGMIEANARTFASIASLVKRSWEIGT